MADNFDSGVVSPDAAGAADDAEAKAAKRARDQEIVAEVRAFVALVEEVESEQRRLELKDLKFLAGDQWDPAIRQARELDKRPCLTVNRLPQFIQQVTNDQRQNRPSIKVHPVDDAADVETAKKIQGLVRHIEYYSSADSAYDNAFESACGPGRGYFRLLTEYCDPMSFDQEILIKRIPNHFSVYFDPASVEPDGSDSTRCVLVDNMTKDAYEQAYPDSDLAKDTDWGATGNTAPEWVKKDGCRIAEYFKKEFEPVELALLSTGETLEKADAEKAVAEAHAAAHQRATAQAHAAHLALGGYLSTLPQVDPEQVEKPVKIVQERKSQKPVIRWYKVNGVEVLDETELPGKYIPVVPVYGNERNIDGKRIFEGIVRHAIDPQMMLNVWKSAETESIALTPKSPYIGYEGQFEGFEDMWETANQRNHAYLQVKPITVGNQPAPLPQRQSFEPAVQAITQAAMFAADDLKATTGIYDASLGAKSNETSGVAIQRRNNQAQTSNFHLIDNLTRSLKHGGRIIVGWIPFVYDAARTARIIGEDGTQEVVPLNQPVMDENGKPKTGKDGKPVIYDVTAGTYDVTVDVGPSFASKRQEAAQSMIEMSRSMPVIGQAAPDLIARNMDWPGAQELADRLKKTLPPNLVSDDKGQPEIPPQVKAQLDHASQMVEQLSKHLHAAQDELDKKKPELESKERIAMADIQAKVEIALAQIGAKEGIALLEQQVGAIQHQLEMLHMGQANNIAAQSAAMSAQNQIAPQGPQDGGESAGPGPQAQPQPTGGASPGQPMEQSNVDPSHL